MKLYPTLSGTVVIYFLYKVFSSKAVSQEAASTVLMQINLLMDLTYTHFMCAIIPLFPVS